MNLVIDSGNTLCKLALFEKDNLLEKVKHNSINRQILAEFCKGKNIDAAILATVTTLDEKLHAFMQSFAYFITLSEQTLIPIQNLYESPETLGSDRLACAVAAEAMYPKSNVLVIDAGTCIKYDFVDEKGSYLGGAISPGLHMRLKALHTFTGRLPLVELSEINEMTGKNTSTSILSGAVNGALLEMDGRISYYKKNYTNLKVILTGGDSIYFAHKLNNRNFVVPELLLSGLNHILNFNASKKA